jgi:Phosphotransferase enzyme family
MSRPSGRGAPLAATLAIDYLPGANLKGAVAGATWRYLLPSMEQRRLLCLGRPSPAALAALCSIAEEIVVVEGDGARAIAVAGEPRIRSIAGAAIGPWLASRPDRSIDLAWVGPHGAGRETRELRAQLGRLLARDGAVVREDRHAVAMLRDHRPPRHTAGPELPDHAAIIDVQPTRGEIRTAIGAGDEYMVRLFGDRGLAPKRGRRLRPVRTLIGRLSRRAAPERHLAVVGEGSTLPDVPTYISGLAAADGVDLGGFRCGLVAGGDYNTQKVLLYLAPDRATSPSLVVKLTRDASVNARLETERDALRHLESLGLAADGRIPTVRFAGRHAGLAIVGETAVDGVPFAQAMGAQAIDGPIVDATRWLIDLGGRSARHASASEVAVALADLHARWVDLCQPAPAEAARLRAAVEAIGASSVPFPLVFQHGDPGTWNLFVTADGRVVFLDWENAEPDGMPLWDLLYLLRSQAVGVGRRAGTRRRLVAVERFMFERSPMSDLVVEAIAGYVERVGLDPALVEPIFHLCWMHQALKEATRVTPAQVRGAHFNRLLRLGLERRTAPTLQRIFAVPQ